MVAFTPTGGSTKVAGIDVESGASQGLNVAVTAPDTAEASLPAGTATEVIAHVKPSKEAVTGDYGVSFSVGTKETAGSAQFRVSVKTSTVWGLAAVGVILAAVCGLGLVFKRYGRR